MYSDEFIERFQSRIKKTDGCWEWQGNKDSCGYGVIKFHQRALKTHRVAYELATGNSPVGMCVLHTCDNPACVNPEHLYLGTPSDNAKDRSMRGRSGDIRGEKNGRAKLNETQVKKIRELFKEGNISKMKLGRMFGVTDVQIGLIVRNKEWKG